MCVCVRACACVTPSHPWFPAFKPCRVVGKPYGPQAAGDTPYLVIHSSLGDTALILDRNIKLGRISVKIV
jgi:hypothetical protein